MKILYKKILNLELWHDYLLKPEFGQNASDEFPPPDYNITETLTVVPTPECQQILRKLRWVLRPAAHGATLFASVAQVNQDFQTVINVDQPYRLTFWLLVKNPYFANFTNLPLESIQGHLYYFSNLSKNKDDRLLYLSQPLPTYTEGEEYALGELVTDENDVLEAIQPQDSASESPNIDFWQIVPKSQYVTAGDRLPRQGRTRQQKIKNANPGDTFNLSMVDENQQKTFVFEGTVPESHPSGQDFIANLNFNNQKPGRYRLFFNNTELTQFVLVDPFSVQNEFALVEIFCNLDLDPEIFPLDFRFLEKKDNRQTVIRPKTYIIRFKNRSTRWRYNDQKLQELTPGSLFEKLNEAQFATQKPISLRQRPPNLEDPRSNSDRQLLPIPKVTLITPEFQPESKQIANIFSDIYL